MKVEDGSSDTSQRKRFARSFERTRVRKTTYEPVEKPHGRSCMTDDQEPLLHGSTEHPEEFAPTTNISRQFSAKSLTPRDPLSGSSARMMSAFYRVASIPQESDWRASDHATGGMANVMFMESTCYGLEGADTEILVDVLRTGTCEDVASVDYSTIERSAKASIHYVHSEGTLVFNPGVRMMQISVKLIDDTTFHPTFDFAIQLANPKRCRIQKRGSLCEATIIDNDHFPSNEGALIVAAREGEVDLKHNTLLFYEYVKRSMQDPLIFWRTIAAVFLDWIDNTSTMMNLIVQLYIIDILFSHSPESRDHLFFNKSRTKTGMAVTFIMLVPMLLRFVADTLRIRLDLEGHCVNFLRRGLFRKHVNWSPAARATIGKAEFAHALLNDPREIVNDGYLTFLRVVRLISKLLLIILIGVWNQGQSWPIVIPGVFLSVAAIILSRCMIPPLAGETAVLGSREAVFVHDTNECDTNIDLVQDYRLSEIMGSVLEDTSTKLRATVRHVNRMEKNSAHVFSWVGAFVASLCVFAQSVYCATSDVCEGRGGTAGEIVTMVTVSHDLASDFREIFSCLTALMQAIATLHNYSRLMNLPTDLQNRRKSWLLTRHKVFEDVEKILKSGQCSPSSRDALDEICIQLHDVHFESISVHETYKLHVPYVEIPQETMTCILGEHGHGRKRLLQSFAGKVNAKSGLVFVPPHLEVLHVSENPLLFNQTLWFNLTLGRETSDPDRIRRVLERIDCGVLIELYDDERELDFEEIYVNSGLPWYSILSLEDLAMVNFARGFCKDPHLLLLASPHTHVARAKHDAIFNTMRDFVQKRGIGHFHDLSTRRKRTCMFTSHFPREAINHSDLVLRLHDSESEATLTMERGGFSDQGLVKTVTTPLDEFGMAVKDPEVTSVSGKPPPPDKASSAAVWGFNTNLTDVDSSTLWQASAPTTRDPAAGTTRDLAGGAKTDLAGGAIFVEGGRAADAYEYAGEHILQSLVTEGSYLSNGSAPADL
mmetsp:Transcript_20114/g.36757  ORF Transcript_20114/g.36757 Transcript_20114/m.36757 type:complete len:996 (+) Transcript_20114:150-3137(+)